MRKRLFVDNCAPGTTTESLRELFRGAGHVDSVTIPGEAGKGDHAFVVMGSAGEAAAAIQMFNGSHWNGQALTVTLSSEPPRATGFRGGQNRGERKNR